MEERRFDRGSPIVNFQLPVRRAGLGGHGRHRAAVGIDPPAPLPAVTLAELRENGTIDLALESFLAALVRATKNVLVTGGTAIGKTTLLRASPRRSRRGSA